MKKEITINDDRIQDCECPVSPESYEPDAKPVNLAQQGGGAHGAYAWCIIDRFLEDFFKSNEIRNQVRFQCSLGFSGI